MPTYVLVTGARPGADVTGAVPVGHSHGGMVVTGAVDRVPHLPEQG
ncbi:hypothetical protein ACSHWO_31450 [Streptomyces sp. HUAS TT3]